MDIGMFCKNRSQKCLEITSVEPVSGEPVCRQQDMIEILPVMRAKPAQLANPVSRGPPAGSTSQPESVITCLRDGSTYLYLDSVDADDSVLPF